MNNIMIFENNEVEVFEFEGKVLFNPKHVAKCLDIKNVNDNIRTMNGKQVIKLKNSNIGNTDIRKLNNAGENFLTESGVYKLIFKSRKEEAERFQDWVTDEVLPSIRKHGAYMTDNVIDAIYNDPQTMIDLLIKLKDEKEARLEAERKNNILMHTNKTYTATEIAKEVGLKSARKLNEILCDMKIQYKVNGSHVLFSDYSNLGYVIIKQEILDNGKTVYNRYFTQDGREFILGLLNK